MERERYFSTAHFPLAESGGKLSGGVPHQPLNTPGTSIPSDLPAAWWLLEALNPISLQALSSLGFHISPGLAATTQMLLPVGATPRMRGERGQKEL